MLLLKNPQKSLGAAPTCKMSMARPSAIYIGPFSTNSLISMAPPDEKIIKSSNKIKYSQKLGTEQTYVRCRKKKRSSRETDYNKGPTHRV
jgi:hypothetical protein